MRGREHLLESITRELTLISRHQLASAARGALERSAYLMLSRIDAAGPMTARELATALQLEISTVTRQVSAMLRADVVERIPDPAGGLARRIRITPTGAALLATDRERHRTSLDKGADRLAGRRMRRAEPPVARAERTHRTAAGHPVAPWGLALRGYFLFAAAAVCPERRVRDMPDVLKGAIGTFNVLKAPFMTQPMARWLVQWVTVARNFRGVGSRARRGRGW